MPGILSPGITRLILTAALVLATVLTYRGELLLITYAPFMVAILYSVALSFEWPPQLLRPLPQVTIDAVLISCVVIFTGGSSSPFVWLYLLATLGLARSAWAGMSLTAAFVGTASIILTFVGILLVVGENLGTELAFLFVNPLDSLSSILSSLGAEFEIEITAFVLALGFLCMGGWVLGRDRRQLVTRAHELETEAHTTAVGHDYTKALARRFAQELNVAGERVVLELTVSAAVSDLGARYAYVTYFGPGSAPANNERTHDHNAISQSAVADLDDPLITELGDHDGIHQLILSSLDTKEPIATYIDLAGTPRVVCAPILDEERRNTGALVACDPHEERAATQALAFLASCTGVVLSTIIDPQPPRMSSPSGADPLTRIPNRASLRRLLEQDMIYEGRVSVALAEVRGLEALETHGDTSQSEMVLREVVRMVSRGYDEVFRFSEERLAVVIRGGRGRTRREADGLHRRILDALAKAEEILLADTAPAQTHTAYKEAQRFTEYQCFVGFAEAIAPFSPEALLVDCESALADARESAEGIAGPGRIAHTGPAGSLMSAMDDLEPLLAAHMRGVSDIARRISEHLGLEPELSEAVELGSLLHDIGKLYLSSEIAHEHHGALVRQEQIELEEVPLRGERMLRGRGEQELHEQVYSAVLYHREAYDGTGYPGAIAGEEIPLSARITHVADVIDDFLRSTAAEPFNHYVGLENLARGNDTTSLATLRTEIVTSRAVRYDPEVADAALAVIDELEEPD